mmetsp:Transcript_114874/g.366455  ORF Transcript_114874/g.366455 Transcript_114874/m.366455 type:complete len:202 (+) Transcript_114874:1-606(+)
MGHMGGMAGMAGMANMAGMGMAGMAGMGGMGPVGCMGGMGGGMHALGSMPGVGGMMAAMGGLGGIGCLGGMGAVGSAGSSSGPAGPGGAEDGERSKANGPGGKDNFALGKDLVTSVMDDMPSYVTQDPRGFVLRSALPSHMAGNLQQKAAQVMDTAGTKITIQGDSGSSARIMSIEGPLFNVCASYMLMMRRYLEAERGAG